MGDGNSTVVGGVTGVVSVLAEGRGRARFRVVVRRRSSGEQVGGVRFGDGICG